MAALSAHGYRCHPTFCFRHVATIYREAIQFQSPGLAAQRTILGTSIRESFTLKALNNRGWAIV